MQTLPESVPSELLFRRLRERQAEASRMFGQLTKCEQDVLELVSSGLPNKTIACRMNRSIKTIEKHRGKLMKKLGVSSLSDLLRFWFCLHWDKII